MKKAVDRIIEIVIIDFTCQKWKNLCQQIDLEKTSLKNSFN